MDPKLLIDTIRTMVVILGGLGIGYGLRKTGRLPESAANPLNRFALIVIQPFVIALALWMMKRVDWHCADSGVVAGLGAHRPRDGPRPP